MESKNKESHFEKENLNPGGLLADCGLSYRPENSPIPVWTQLQPHLAFVLTPAPNAKGPGGVMPTCALSNRPTDLLCPDVDHEVACDLVAAPLGFSLEAFRALLSCRP